LIGFGKPLESCGISDDALRQSDEPASVSNWVKYWINCCVDQPENPVLVTLFQPIQGAISITALAFRDSFRLADISKKMSRWMTSFSSSG
jgi:hypothetical protein